jgi:hypothetical protein
VTPHDFHKRTVSRRSAAQAVSIDPADRMAYAKSAIDFRQVIHKRLIAGEPRTFNPHLCAWG